MKVNVTEQLKKIRFLYKVTQSDMAKIIGISKRGYESIEYGKINLNIDYMIKICQHFKISCDDFLNLKKENIFIKLSQEQAIVLNEIAKQINLKNNFGNININSNNTINNINNIKIGNNKNDEDN